MSMTLSFFFSSRRRHTRSTRDWSSDVCSSDLVSVTVQMTLVVPTLKTAGASLATLATAQLSEVAGTPRTTLVARSEERRVGKECRSGWATDDGEKKDRA